MAKEKTQIVDLKSKLNKIWGHLDLSSTCCRQCGCCRVACPQMKYSEAVNIITEIWDTWSKEDKKQLLKTCIRYFFSRSLVKPCPMLDGDTCRVYENRPENCRLYGLWPKEMWERRVESIAKKLDLPKEQIPLNQQCQFVKRTNGKPLTESEIEGAFASLDELDVTILSEGDPSRKQEWAGRVERGWNYRSIHDFILLRFFGEEWLMNLTSVAMSINVETIEKVVQEIEKSIDGMEV